jgi:hypothetical protein
MRDRRLLFSFGRKWSSIMTVRSRAMEFQHLGTLESKMNLGQSLVGFGGRGIRKRSFDHSDYIPRDDHILGRW